MKYGKTIVCFQILARPLDGASLEKSGMTALRESGCAR